MKTIDSTLLLNAIVALKRNYLANESKKISERSSTPLFTHDSLIHVQLSLSEIPKRSTERPIRIDIPHPLYNLPCINGDVQNSSEYFTQDVSVCLLIKDSSKEWISELISRYHKKLYLIKKVLTLSSLRKKHGTYAARRELLRRFDIFLADDRILPMLAKFLGKNFFKAKKQPVPIKITRKEAFPLAVYRCLKATFMCLNPGTCVSIRAGNTSMSNDVLCANVQAIVINAVTKLPGKWDILSSVLIKTPHSVSLPIYTKSKSNYEERTMMVNNKSHQTDEDPYPGNEDKNRVYQGSILENKYKKQRLSTSIPVIN